jgi:Flp pilus assembly protein TadG
MLHAIHRRLRKLRRDPRGATAVEFALIAPVLVAIVMGIIEFGLIIFTYTTAGVASRDVARRIATGRIAATTATASSTLTPQLPAWVRSYATVSLTQTTPGTASTNIITVTVSFPALRATPTTFLSFAYGFTLATATTMQQES